MPRFSRNFSSEEFLKTNRKIKLAPTLEELENMRNVAMFLLQPLREDTNEVILITENGGFRGNGLNELIGGSEKSDHIHGKATDITCKKFSKLQLFHKLLETVKKKNLSFKQIILELDSNCLHLSYAEGENRCEILVRETVSGKKIYKRLSLEQGIDFSGNFSDIKT